jgi:D-lactate dehydrogenase
MKIVFYETTGEDQDNLKTLISQSPQLKDATVTFVPEKFSDANIATAQDAEVIGVFVASEVRQAHIDQLPNLKLIVTLSTGFDHIDWQYAQSKNIGVSNVPAYGSRTVAEYTFALMLGLSRKAFAAYRELKDNHDFAISNYEGFNLQGKTLGIVGTGKIGQNVAKIAKGFEMNILGFDAFPNQKVADELDFKYLPLEELLAQSDIVTLHVPYNKDTHHLINQTNINKFKPGAILINTSRGEVAETEAILEGIKNNILSAAGIDVIEGERQLMDEWAILSPDTGHEENLKMVLEDRVLIDQPKVAYTPHIAFFTKEAKHEIVKVTVDNIAGFLAGQPQNQVK